MKSWCWFGKRMSWASSVIDILYRKRIALKSGPALTFRKSYSDPHSAPRRSEFLCLSMRLDVEKTEDPTDPISPRTIQARHTA